MKFNEGDKVRVVAYADDSEDLIGLTGTVKRTRTYVSVRLDDWEDRYGIGHRLFLEEELELVSEDEEVDVFNIENVDDYAIRGVEYSGGFEFFYKPTGKVLLNTQFVSLDTLLRIVEDHQEENR